MGKNRSKPSVKVSQDVLDIITSRPEIEKIHFCENGDHHIRIFPEIKNGRETGNFICGGTKKKIVSSLTREEILTGETFAKPEDTKVKEEENGTQ